MRRRLLLDVDGVCGDIMTPALKAVEEVGGGTWDPATFPTWEVFDTVDRKYRERTLALWRTPGWCAAIEPYPEAVEAVEQLKARDVHVIFVTSPMVHSPHWMWERDQWLREHFGAVSEDIVFTKAKYLVHGDAFVDDNLDHVLRWKAEHPREVSVLWRRPCSKNVLVPHGVLHSSSWDDVHDLF